jgi:hypothetical protein
MCEAPFWKDPLVIFRNFSLQYDPTCNNQIWNFLARLLMIGVGTGLFGAPVCGSASLIISILFISVVAIVIIMTTKVPKRNRNRNRVDDNGDIITDFTMTVPVGGYDEVQLTPAFSSWSGNPGGCKNNTEGFTAGNAKANTKANTTANTKANAKANAKANGNGSTKAKEGFVTYSTLSGDEFMQMSEPSSVFGIEAKLPYGDGAPYSGPALPEYTPPVARNLFMNVLIDEYKYNPDRPPASPVTNPIVKQTFDDYFRVQWFSDPTDVFGKNQSQRQFVTQPSTSIPNDRESYQNWLYRIPGKTCKEGGQYCTTRGSAGSPVVWLGE